MRIAVIGAGGIGGYFGAVLARSGQDVTFIVRPATLDALRRGGLTVTSAAGDFTVPVVATDDAASIGVVDVVLQATKAAQLVSSLQAALPMIGPRTLVLTTQNGVEAPELAASVVGQERVVPCACRIWTRLVRPGVVQHHGGPGTVTFATWQDRADPRVDALRAAFRGAGVSVVEPDSIWADLWSKALFVVPLGGLGAAAKVPVGVLRHPDALRDTLRATMDEIAAVAAARGVALASGIVDATLDLIDQQPAGSTTSMQRDLMEGRPSELDTQIGAICRFGDAAGIPTPLHDLIYTLLSPASTPL